MKRPKLQKLPKQPKESASPETWLRYEEKVKSVIAKNRKRLEPYKKAVAVKERVKNLVSKLKLGVA